MTWGDPGNTLSRKELEEKCTAYRITETALIRMQPIDFKPALGHSHAWSPDRLIPRDDLHPNVLPKLIHTLFKRKSAAAQAGALQRRSKLSSLK